MLILYQSQTNQNVICRRDGYSLQYVLFTLEKKLMYIYNL